MTSEPTTKINKICKTPNCGRQLQVREFCIACYYRNLRQGKLEAGSRTGKWKHRLSHIDVEAGTANCAECGNVKIRSRGNGKYRCGVESDERSRLYKEAYRASKKAMLIGQCEICGKKEKLCWDHCHNEGHFRGTLCTNCNKGLGMFFDNPIFLVKAAKYVKNRRKEKMGSAL